MSKSRARFLSELLGTTGLVKKAKSALAGADEVIDLSTLPSIPNSKLTNSSISVAGHSTALGDSVTLNTGDIGEHTNYLYYTNARARGAISVSGSTISYDSSTGVITSSANNYVLPTATSSALGGVKIGYSENGKNYPVELSSGQMYVNVPWVDTNTTYSIGDGGLTQNNFTTTLKNKLDGIESGATADQTQSDINALGITATGLSGSPNITVGSITANDLVTENSTTKDSQGPYDWVTVGSGSRAAALRINDIAGANYLIRAGGYGLRFMKHVDAATDSFRDIMRFTATGVGDTTPHVVISNNLTVGGSVTWSGGSSANANTAYGWGNHASAGYLTSHQSLAAYAPLASPALTGTPTSPTASAGTNTTQIATTAFVGTAVSNLVDSAPGTLDTLNELAAALGDDANFSTTVTNSIATKLPLAGGTMTGALSAPTITIDTTSNTAVGLRIQRASASGRAQMTFEDESNSAQWRVGMTGSGSEDFSFFNGSANVLLLDRSSSAATFSGDITGARLIASANGTSTSPTISISSPNSATFIHASNAFAANMTAGQFVGHFFGRAGSAKNSGAIGYYYSSAGSNDNFISLGHWDNNHLLRIYGSGTVRIHSGDLQFGSNTVINSSRNITINQKIDNSLGTLLDHDGSNNYIKGGGGGSNSLYTEASHVFTNSHVTIGNTASKVLKSRHIDGKAAASTSYENLYLNYYAGNAVIVGRSDQNATLQVHGPIQQGTTTVIDTNRNITNIASIGANRLELTGTGGTYTAPSQTNVPSIYVYNTGTTATSHAIVAVRSTGASGGDAFVSFDIGGVQGYSLGIDNSDGDKFKLSYGWSALGTNDRLVIDTSGNTTISGTLASGAITTSGNLSMTGGHSIYLGTTSRFSSDNNGSFGINYGTTGGTNTKSLVVYNNTSEAIVLNRNGTISSGAITSSGNINTLGNIQLDSHKFVDQAEYSGTSIFSQSGDWYTLAGISETVTPAYFALKFGAHSTMTFVVTTGYSGSNVATIMVLGSTWTQNGGYPGASELRVIKETSSGIYYVQMRLTYSSSTPTAFQLYARTWGATPSSGTPSFVSSLAAYSAAHTAISHVYTNYTGSGSSEAHYIDGGSNSFPSYSFSGDTNTGMYRDTADSIGFATNGTQRVTISNSGLDVKSGGNFFVRDTADLSTSGGYTRVTTGSLGVSNAGTRGFIMDGNYTNGQYRHRWRKQDNGGGVPLFLDYAAGTANSFTEIARFGPYSGNTENFEVYGNSRITGNLGVGMTAGTSASARLHVLKSGAGLQEVARFSNYNSGGEHSFYVHVDDDNNYVRLQSSGSNAGNIQLMTGNDLRATVTANVNSTNIGGINLHDNRLGFDQSGTRSWTMGASGGNLNVYSGDGNGAFVLNSSMRLQVGTNSAFINSHDQYHGIIIRGVPNQQTGYGITAGNYISFMEFGSDFRFYEKSTSTLSLDAQILEGSYKSWKNSDNFVAQTASDPTNYYAKFSANYNYAQAFDIKARGAGSEWTLMKWADAAGLEFNGGANKVVKIADSNYLNFGTMTTANQFDISIGTQTTSRGIRIAPYASWGTRYSGWDNWIGTNVSTAIGTTNSGVQQMTSYTNSGASALNVGFQELSFYNWSPSTLSGNAAHTSLTIPTPRFRITAAGDLQINGTTIVNASSNLSNPVVQGVLCADRQFNNGGIGFSSGGFDSNHHLWNDYYGGPGARGAANQFDGMKWNTYRGIHIRGGSAGAYNCIVVTNSGGANNDHSVTLYNSDQERFVTQTEGVYVNGALYASASAAENTPYGTTNTHVIRNEGSSNGTNGGGTLFVNDRGNHSWGTVAEFRINTAGDSDNPTIIFSSAAEGTNTWGIGYGYTDTNFRINRDHGHRTSTWGVAMMTLDRSGNATFAGNVTAYSDKRLKENIETIPDAVETVKKIRGVTFDWKETGEEGMGVIAQELEEVEILKCLVRETPKDGVSEFAQKNVAYGNMVGLLIEAIKEQSAQINAQQEQINELTKMVNALMEK